MAIGSSTISAGNGSIQKIYSSRFHYVRPARQAKPKPQYLNSKKQDGGEQHHKVMLAKNESSMESEALRRCTMIGENAALDSTVLGRTFTNEIGEPPATLFLHNFRITDDPHGILTFPIILLPIIM
jgi:hypothetical protein